MNQNEIYVTIKNVYGNETIYPDCPKSRLLAKLSQRKTFTSDSIRVIKELGYVLIVRQAEVSL